MQLWPTRDGSADGFKMVFKGRLSYLGISNFDDASFRVGKSVREKKQNERFLTKMTDGLSCPTNCGLPAHTHTRNLVYI